MLKKLIKNYANKPVVNYFKTNYKKRAIISYIAYPFNLSLFIKYLSKKHSKVVQVIEIANVLNKLGYIVDIVDHGSNVDLNYKYDLIFGIEPNFTKMSIKYSNALKVYYGTGCYAKFSNLAEKERQQYLFKRKNVKLQLRRQVENCKYIEYADYAILMGNKFTINTYKEVFDMSKIYTINNFVDSDNSIKFKKKNFDKVRYNFLWLGGYGALHKGLDVVLDTFKGLPQYNLYVCGDLKREKDFYNLYEKELTSLPNVYYKGWVNTASRKFDRICENCCYIIYPSSSEANAGSVLIAMNKGLIPIITESTSIDLSNDKYYIKSCRIEDVKKKISDIIKEATSQSYEQDYLKFIKYTNNTYSKYNYTNNIKNIMSAIIKRYESEE